MSVPKANSAHCHSLSSPLGCWLVLRMEANHPFFPPQRCHLDAGPQAQLQRPSSLALAPLEPPQSHQCPVRPRPFRLAPQIHLAYPPEPERLKSPSAALKTPALNDFAVHGFAKPLPTKPLDCNAGVPSARVNTSLTGETRIPQTRHSPLLTRYFLCPSPLRPSRPRATNDAISLEL
jgi:hypothetical protein